MITVLGLGFVGLTTGLGFAKKGFKTYGFDISEERMNSLRNLKIPFFEPHLKEVLEETLDKTFFLEVPFEEAIRNSDAVFICVGTPEKNDGSADLTYLLNALDQVINIRSDRFQVIVTKSTVPPSTVSNEVIPFVNGKLQLNKDRKVGFASNPEFLREGYCWEDFINPDRIVIGVEDERSKNILDNIYKPFNAPVHYVNYNTSEFIKYLSNTLLSTLISYSNEMSMIADAIGKIDVKSAFRILHEDKRWYGSPAPMKDYVYPGCGYGGYCLPKDTAALVKISERNGFKPSMLSANIFTNNIIKTFLVNRLNGDIGTDEPIGILGLSFKPGSDDVRFSPARDIIKLLIKKGYRNICAYDPEATDEFIKHNPEIDIRYVESLHDIVDKCEYLLLLTAWEDFKTNKELIKTKNLIDFRYAL
ncbi:MAG: UDP-glucose dehydrogenase family protein [Bacteroidales bacterium]